MRAWYANLSERDRRVVNIGSVVTVILVILAIIVPLNAKISQTRRRIETKQGDLAFIQNVAQRRQTIKKITEAIVRAQPEFLRQGVRALKPLTRSQIAEAISLDESTVSRATNGKHVLLPSGEVISFDTFFSPQLAIHAVIQEILAAEKRAMTDAEIMRALQARGIQIARRTVAKYRGQIGVLPSVLRDRGPLVRAA